MFRSRQNRCCCFSLMKITIPKMFRSMPRIILVGAGNVLGPSGIFQKMRSWKNTLSQFWGTRSHESGVACLVAFCLGNTHVSWRHVGGLLPPPMGGTRAWPAKEVSSLGPHLLHLLTLTCVTCGMGILVFSPPPHPLPWPINRGCVGCHFSSILSNTCHWTCLASLSLPAKEFRRAERLFSFRQGLVLDGEALLDR